LLKKSYFRLYQWLTTFHCENLLPSPVTYFMLMFSLSNLKSFTRLSCIALTGLGIPAQAAVVAFEFNTAGSTENWGVASTTIVTGFKQATGIDGTSGVLTSTDLTTADPQITRTTAANTIVLPVGEQWSNFEIRFRQLNGNPAAAGVAAVPYVQSGTILFFNGSTANVGAGSIPLGTTTTRTGTGAFAGDTYALSLVADPLGGEWYLLNVGFSSAPILRNQNITGVRFDPLGDSANKNFEIDYVRLTSVPETSSAALALLALGTTLVRRRR
jgi:MYXO-CTERM domain-containing protein